MPPDKRQFELLPVDEDAAGEQTVPPIPQKKKFVLEEATDADLGNINFLEDVKNIQGVSNIERFTGNWLSNHPQDYKRYLLARGYEVKAFGSGFNFAVKKPEDEDWKVADPKGITSGTEVVKDLVDWSADVGQGIAIDLFGVAGGILGGAAGGLGGTAFGPGPGTIGGGAAGAALGTGIGLAVGGVATDLVRQQMGVAVGAAEEVDPLQAATVGAFSAAAPGVGGFARRRAAGTAKFLREKAPEITRRAGAGTRELLGKLAGVKGKKFLEIDDIMDQRAASMPHSLVSAKDSADIMRGWSRRLRTQGFAQQDVVAEEVGKATDAGAKVRMNDVVDTLNSITSDGIADPQQFALFKSVRDRFLGRLDRFIPEDPAFLGIRTGGKVVKGAPSRPVPEITDFAARETLGIPRPVAPPLGGTPSRIVEQGTRKAVRPGQSIDVPVAVADDMKRELQGIADRLGAFGRTNPQAVKKETMRALETASRKLRASLVNKMGGEKSRYAQANDILSRRRNLLDRLDVFLGSEAPKRGSVAAGEANVRSAFGQQSKIQFLEQMDREFGTEFADMFWETLPDELRQQFKARIAQVPGRALIRGIIPEMPGRQQVVRSLKPGFKRLAEDAAIGEEFGASTRPRLTPRFTAVGTLLGPSVLAGLGGAVGFTQGGPIGAAAGVVGGLGLASPAVQTRFIRAARGFGAGPKRRAAGRTVREISRGTRTLAAKAVEKGAELTPRALGLSAAAALVRAVYPESPNKGIAREDAKRRDIREGRFQD